MKRIIAFFLILVISAGLLAGCGSGGGDAEESGNSASSDGSRTLTIGIPQSSAISSYTKDNGFTDYLQEKAGIELKFYYFSSTPSEYRQQLALMCSANQELPDVLLGISLEHYTMNQYGEDGYFLDLTELIEKYADNYKKALAALKETDPEVATYASEKVKNTNNGAIYGMPRVMPIATDSLQSLMHINKNWLDQLGLAVPTTLDELENVLQQFASNDLNGNGQNDEIAMIGGAGVRDYIINAFVYFQDTAFNVTDGKVWDPVYTDEFRQALIYGNDLVKKGLYDSKSFTITTNGELRNLISPVNAPSKVGVFTGLSTVMTNVNSPAIGEFTVMPALADATGKGGYMIIGERQVDWSGFITKDCEDPELAMKFLDLFYDDETVSRQRHGVEGVDWVRYDGTNGSGTKSYVKQINSEAFFEGKSTWGGNMLGILTDYNYLTVSEEAATERIAQTQRLVKETWDLMHAAREAEERAVHLVYTPEEYSVREEKQNLATTYLVEQITLFFAGEKDPSDDAQWNEFLDTLTGLGRKELLDIAQHAYDRK
ncbi:MAG: extracellular solute-binding protein [Lachnospiraceae bacterium]|nr:extracellular solute-binding protein [Lachnospiraceae bacterium]